MIITISGTPGSGKSTIAKGIAKILGMKHHSIGDLMKRLAQKKKISLIELSKKAENDEKIDLGLDSELKRLAKTEDNFVADTRMGFYFIPNSIKIFVKVKPEIAAKRLLKDVKAGKRKTESEAKTLQEALRLVKERLDSERKRYKKYYGVDFTDEKNYDFVMDTSKLDIKKSLDKALSFIRTRLKQQKESRAEDS
ncbi:hypothetical protein DRJ25_04880 [Candidatus Woesearchaeota archaeon]|nr:MAG: hypothetical protein DRJ25_04880 [Candidatus Woesearchaeota archaeon]